MVKIKINANIEGCEYKIKNLDVILKDINSFKEIEDDNMSIDDSDELIKSQVFKTYGLPIENIRVLSQGRIEDKIKNILEFLKENEVMINSCMDDEERKTFKYGIVDKIINILNGKLYED